MNKKPGTEISASTYVINRSAAKAGYTVWKMDLESPKLFIKSASYSSTTLPGNQYNLCAVGGYLLAYSKPDGKNFYDYDYSLLKFQPDAKNPLDVTPHLKNKWSRSKFISYSNHLTWNPKDQGNILQLIPMTGYVLSYIPTSARATYNLWNFDPALDRPYSPKGSTNSLNNPDPLSNEISTMDAFSLIGENSRLLPIDNYVLEWIPSHTSSNYRVWSFDPQQITPIQLPAILEGKWTNINSDHQLLVLDHFILDWVPADRSYRLWLFDPHQKKNPLVGPIKSGTLPSDFNASSVLTPVQTTVPVDAKKAKIPGTMDFMRDKIEHVVVYMLESRSMDSVLGWLYENSKEKINFINGPKKYDGTSLSYSNDGHGKTFNVYKANDGELSQDFALNAPSFDPYHGMSDSIHQQYSGGYPAYLAGDTPDMGGFVKNNCSGDVMVTLTPTQLPVLNGLAVHFAVSDKWFSAMPGVTDSNRAFALTGSAFNITTTLEGNTQYEYFPDNTHRQSMWKVLWSHGIKDWKIYWSVDWLGEVFTYQLYLKGDIPSVDNDVNDEKTTYIAPIEQFKLDAKNNTLPAFSFLEPVWIAPSGATSYHPGSDLVPAEKALNEIYEAIATGPGWEKTALIITFSKGGGLYDHVAPPKAIKPWPKDINDGFSYDVLGPRVPTIVVSPWVEKHTVFRSPGKAPLSATSLPATILEWFGIPKTHWGLGDRVPQSETFEFVFERSTPRKDLPKFTPPYDSTYPPLVSAKWKDEKGSRDAEWNEAKHWSHENVPTDIAHFSRSEKTRIFFNSNKACTIQSLEFDAQAPSYEFNFGTSKYETTALTIAGSGVSNASHHQQRFFVAASKSSPRHPQLNFTQNSCAGGNNVFYEAGPDRKINSGGGVIRFNDNSRAGSAKFLAWTGKYRPDDWNTVGGEIAFYDNSSADLGTFEARGTLGTDGDTFGNIVFHVSATAFKGNFTCTGGTVPHGDGGNTQFFDNSTAAYGTFNNLGATVAKGNGGDVAFDGNATAGFGTFYNQASETNGGNGGVTSFNNNAPAMADAGATAGNGIFHNYGARTSGGGGHTKFTAVYGSCTAGNATIINYGSAAKNEGSAGYTQFSIQLPSNYYSTAGSAVIHNQPAAAKGGIGGRTVFELSAGYGKSLSNNQKHITSGRIPTAGNASIYNIGGKSQGVAGGTSLFSDTSTAGDARIFAHGGHDKGKGGSVTFKDFARAGSARLVAEGGTKGGQGGQIVFLDKSEGENAQIKLSGNGVLDVSQHTGKLALSILEVSDGTIAMQLGSKTSSLEVSAELILRSEKMKFAFSQEAGKFKFNTKYTVLTCPNLQHYKVERFTGNSMAGVRPSFSMAGNSLKVEYKKA